MRQSLVFKMDLLIVDSRALAPGFIEAIAMLFFEDVRGKVPLPIKPGQA